MKKWMLVLFVALFVLPCSREADAAGRKKKGKNAATAKVTEKKSAYDKLFQKESCETVKSNFITLHSIHVQRIRCPGSKHNPIRG